MVSIRPLAASFISNLKSGLMTPLCLITSSWARAAWGTRWEKSPQTSQVAVTPDQPNMVINSAFN